MADYKLDIFGLIKDIKRKRRDLWNNLSAEERKGFAPVVVMRWLSGTSDPLQLLLLNALVNTQVFSLYWHPELSLRLMQVAAVNDNSRAQWLKMENSSTPKRPITEELIMRDLKISKKRATELIKLGKISEEDALNLAEYYGLQKDEVAKVKKEWKK